MPRVSRTPKTPPPPDPQVVQAWRELYREVFYELMIAVVKAEGHEDGYADIRDSARTLTKKQLRTIADLASAYFVEHSNPEPPSRERARELKREAVSHALRQLENDKTKR